MLNEFVETTCKNLIDKTYSHIKLPSHVFVKITAYDQGSGEYTVAVLSDDMVVDTRFPQVPKVISKKTFEAGDSVLACLPYGKLNNIYLLEKVD